MSWWQRFKTWLGISEPGLRREELEDWIEANPSVFARIHAEQASDKDSRGGFRQIRRQDKHLATLPAYAEFGIDVFEAPVSRAPRTTRFGYTLSFTVTEADGSRWVLTENPDDAVDPVWVEVKSVSIR